MTKTKLSSVSAGDILDGVYLGRNMATLQTRTGSNYISLDIADSSASLPAKIWSPETVVPQGLELPGFVRVRARVESYRQELQLNIEAISPASPSDNEIAELVPASEWSPSKMLSTLRAHMEEVVTSPPLLRLLNAILDDDAISSSILLRPAATHFHHTYRGGLLEHTLSMVRVASTLAAHYERYYPGLISEELLVAGTLLHDLGKCWEFEGDLEPSYSTQGRLLGHIPMMANFIGQKASELGDIPAELIMELQHLVLSHHGELEYGAAVRPHTAEAQLLHLIDNIDAKMNVFANALPAEGWSSYVRPLSRAVYQPKTGRDSWQSKRQAIDLSLDGPGLARAKYSGSSPAPAAAEELAEEPPAPQEEPPAQEAAEQEAAEQEAAEQDSAKAEEPAEQSEAAAEPITAAEPELATGAAEPAAAPAEPDMPAETPPKKAAKAKKARKASPAKSPKAEEPPADTAEPPAGSGQFNIFDWQG